MDISLRPLEESDAPFVYQLYASTRAEEIAAWGWPPDQSDAFLKMQFRAQQLHYQSQSPQAIQQIICLAGQPVGRLIFTETPQAVHIADIAIMPEQRGAGIGTTILRNILASATKQGQLVSLHVASHNIRARQLYERLGFRVVSQNATDYRMEVSPTLPQYS